MCGKATVLSSSRGSHRSGSIGRVVLAFLLPGLSAVVGAYEFGGNPNPSLSLESSQAGQVPAHHLRLDIKAGELEVFEARLRYPPGFRFNGFLQAGPAHGQVGAFAIDADGDERADKTIALRSLNDGMAYLDLFADGSYTPQFEPELSISPSAGLSLRLPYGGDADPQTLLAPGDFRATLSLFQGLLANPAVGGSYPVAAELLSVDPDSDDSNDGGGLPPQRVTASLPVIIVGPPPVSAFGEFSVQRATLAKPHRKLRVSLRGRYVLGADSNGLDLPNQDCTLVFGGYRQSLAGQDFSRHRHGWSFNSRAAGIRRLLLFDDGRFRLDASGLELGQLNLAVPQYFALQLGDDAGGVAIQFDRRGRYRPGRGR